MLKILTNQLQDPQPEKRIEALCALVMLQETQALDLLARMWSSEQHAEVKKAIGWAGKQIQAAQNEGYSTIAAMTEALRLDRGPDEKELEEQRKLAQIQNHISVQQTKQYGGSDVDKQISGFTKSAAMSAVIGAGFGLGAGAAMGAMMSSSIASSNIGNNPNRPAIGKEAIVPPKPNTSDIQLWIKKLTSPDTKIKNAAIIQLRDFNNPAALGPLGSVFVRDADPAIKRTAQQTGKQIYFAALYWENPSHYKKSSN